MLRKKFGIPVVIQNANLVWDKIAESPEGTYPESFLEKLPNTNLSLNLSLQQNEMFILGMPEDEIARAIKYDDYKLISENLYRVQKLSESYYLFRHHLETQLIDDTNSKTSKRFYLIQSFKAFYALSPMKVKIDCLGNVSI